MDIIITMAMTRRSLHGARSAYTKPRVKSPISSFVMTGRGAGMMDFTKLHTS
jgi:hypothetical protein